MAFGFPASHAQLIPLNQLSKLQFIQIAICISEKANWSLITIDENQLIAISKNNKRTWNETIYFSFEDDDTVLLQSISNGNQIYDRGKNKKNIETFTNLLYDILKALPSYNFNENLTIEEIKKREDNSTLENKTDSVSSAEISTFYSFFSIFTPVKDYFITPILININILVFFIMLFSGVNFFNLKIQDIIDWGANHGPLTTDSQSWRLLSACFIPTGFFPLLINCIALGYVGLFLESYLKKWGFLILYLFCGIIANLSSLYWNKDSVSAGASGAIFGMYGILLITLLFKVLKKKTDVKQTITILLLILLITYYNFIKSVDYASPIGGLSAGILFGIILFLFRQKKNNALVFISSTTSIAIVCLFINYKNSQVYIYQTMEYDSRIQEFLDMEKMALEAYSTQYGSTFEESKEMALYLIKDRGIYYWNENVTLVTELDKLYLPQAYHKRNKDLIKYCKLRIEVYELAYKKIKENSTEYDSEMEEIDKEIVTLLHKLNETDNNS